MTKLGLLIKGLFALIVLLPLSLCAQDRTSSSQIQVRNLTLNARQISLALQDLAKQYKVVIGLEYEQHGSKSREISIQVEKGTLAEVLDAIVRSNPEYSWTEEPDGAIRVYSRDRVPTLSNVAVASFSVESMPTGRVLEMINRLPEIEEWIAANHCPQRTRS